jgi:small subunit ribosomal protein S10
MNKLTFSLKYTCSDAKILNQYMAFVIKRMEALGLQPRVSALPMRVKRLTLLKSPHVFKRAKEQFEVRAYTRIVTIGATSGLVKTLLLNRPSTIRVALVASI